MKDSILSVDLIKSITAFFLNAFRKLLPYKEIDYNFILIS